MNKPNKKTKKHRTKRQRQQRELAGGGALEVASALREKTDTKRYVMSFGGTLSSVREVLDLSVQFVSRADSCDVITLHFTDGSK
eukprot:3564186-Amphidinium_carterae.1